MYYGDEMFIQDAKMVLDEFGWNSAESTKKKDIIDVIEGRKKIVIYFDANGLPYERIADMESSTVLDFIKYERIKKETV